MKISDYLRSRNVHNLLTLFSILIISFTLTKSLIVSGAISLVSTVIIFLAQRNSSRKFKWELMEAIPEIIDHIISGLQSGLSLTESLGSLAERGPALTRGLFQEFQSAVNSGVRFDFAVEELQKKFSLRTSDQLFEALLFARVLGGSELTNLLRQLGDFTRGDLALRKEIEAKQGWIRNSAHLSAAAPWLLLVLLSMQPSTATAFATSTGVIFLMSGMVLTITAYLWMGKLGKLPEPPRIFGLR